MNGTTRPPYRYSNPANRPAKRQLALAVGERGVPAHLLGKRHRRAARRPARRAARRLAALPRWCLRTPMYSPFGGGDALDLILGHALLLRKAGAGRGQHAVLERGRHRRAHDQLFEVGSGVRRSCRHARSGGAACCRSAPARRSTAALPSASPRAPGQSGRSGPAASWPGSLRCQFREAVRGPRQAPGSATTGICCAAYSLQMAIASWRTRRM